MTPEWEVDVINLRSPGGLMSDILEGNGMFLCYITRTDGFTGICFVGLSIMSSQDVEDYGYI